MLNQEIASATPSRKQITLSLEESLFIKYPVPARGIVCSNHQRAMRLAKRLTDPEEHTNAWGPALTIGTFNGQKIFVASAPVGTGAGLVFTELYVAGAQFILRYGSDDVRKPPESDAQLVKLVDEADNLYEFNRQSGVNSDEWGKAVPASKLMIDTLAAEADARHIRYEKRICHHLENYHGLRYPEKYVGERGERLRQQLDLLSENPKPASFDMESAVLFRVAQDFAAHAATVLQTVDKESKKLSSYEGRSKQQALDIEESIFFDYVLHAMIRMPLQQDL